MRIKGDIEHVRRRSALRLYPLPPERVEAQRAIRDGVDPQVIVGVRDDGTLQYVKENELVKLFKEIPFSQKRRRSRH